MAKRKVASARQLLSLKQPAAQGDGGVMTESSQNVAAAAVADTARQRIAKAAYYRAEKRGFAPRCA